MIKHVVVFLVALAALSPVAAQQLTPVPVQNPAFDQGADANGVPKGWARYAASPTATLSTAPGGKGLVIDDNDPNSEVGVVQTIPLKGGLGYEVAVQIRGFAGRTTLGSYVQLRFLPSNLYVQGDLYTQDTTEGEEVTLRGFAPADTTSALLYLYSHKETTPKVMVTSVKLVSGVTAPTPPPPPVPPVYDEVKDLQLDIPLVLDGKPACSIAAPARYAAAAAVIQEAIRKRTGVKLPLIADTAAGAATPLGGNLIVLGNRSTSKVSSELYDRYYSLMDLKYPGKNGYAVRTLHNPYGNGSGAVLVGGSDDAGVLAGAQAWAAELAKAPAGPGRMLVGWTMLTRLGDGLQVPTDLRQFLTWEDSKSYGNTGYFGWNSISKRMAMYYMTGDPFQAREALRLSFPDAQAMKEIDEIDGERIENKHDPLAGPYHYNAMMMILYWDLIEESPVFSDAERLKVTNAFARRLSHPQDLETYKLNSTPAGVSSRHGQWSALSLYTLGRYFNKYYPSPLWDHAEKAGALAFSSLHKHAWLSGENDNLFWYCTGIAPTVTYLVLSGDKKPVENGVLGRILDGLQVLISGRVPDWALTYGALDLFNKAAYLTHDGRWVTYRERTQVDTDAFRLGQSFWPGDDLPAAQPTDLCGKWLVNEMPRPFWLTRGVSWPLTQSFEWMSCRSAPDSSGDFILVDGFNGASRNPYHTFDLLELRLNGRTLLQGYANQVLTSADGMVEPQVPMDGQLLHRDVVGRTATAVLQVPNLPYCNWRRTIAQRTGQYALIADDLTFRTDSQNTRVNTTWQPLSGAWNPGQQALVMQAPGAAVNLPGWVAYRALGMKCTSSPAGPNMVVPLDSLGIMLLRATGGGQYLDMAFKVTSELSGEAFADLLNYSDRGTVRFFLDGKPVGQTVDSWSEGIVQAQAPLGQVKLAPGDHVLRAEAVAPHPGTDKCFVGLIGLSVKTPQAVAAGTGSTFELRGSDVQETTGGAVVNMNWNGAVKQGDHRRVFYLFGQNVADAPQPLACVQLSPNAAALALPSPALAVMGDYQGCHGDLVVLATDHASGHNVTSIGLQTPLLSASNPVDLEWDFAGGTLSVVASQPTEIKLSGGKTLAVAEGRSALTGCKLTGTGLSEALKSLLATGQAGRQAAVAAVASAAAPSYPDFPAASTASIGGKVTQLVALTGTQGPQLAVAGDKVIHILTPDGKAVRRLETDDTIMSLRWWEKPRLLLAGCHDEKVIAFDETGQRKWVFTSEMDPAVYEAAKSYWFKGAIPGVRGLYTGTFLNGQEQAFIGSACTLEIVDEAGKLVKRLPAFWGPGTQFKLIAKPDGSLDLLFAREPTDGHFMYALNNKTMQLRRGYDGVPSGHTYVGGWANMSRDHIFVADLYGDGKQEVVSEINGAWNRITVWNLEGDQALYNAQFGPGDPIPTRNMRDVDLVDLNGDGRPEIVTATSGGLVVALDGKCRKLWSTRLQSPATCLAAVAGPQPTLVVGCGDGSVLQLDAAGKIQRQGKLDSAAAKIKLVQMAHGPQVVLGSAKGQVAVFAP